METIQLLASDEQLTTYKDFIDELKASFQVVSLEGTQVNKSIPLIALGGDGSLNYLVNKFDCHNLKVIYFPTGTANDFAKTIHLPSPTPSVNKVKSLLRQNIQIPVPIMACNDKKFINVASLGIPAKVTSSGNDLLKKTIGKFSYYLSALEELFAQEYYEIEYQYDATSMPTKIKTHALIVSQGLYAGGGVKVSPSYCGNMGDDFNFITLDTVALSDSVSALIEFQKEEPVLPVTVHSHFCQDLVIRSHKEIPAKLDGEEYSAAQYHFKKTAEIVKFYLH